MENETSFISADPDEAGAVPGDVTLEDSISRGRLSRKIRAGNSLSRSLRHRRPKIAPLHSDNNELFSNSYGTFTNDDSRMGLSSSGEDHVLTIETQQRIQKHRSLGERAKAKWSQYSENVSEKLEFFNVSRAMECYGGGAFSYFKFVVWLGRANFFTMSFYLGAVLLPFFLINPNEDFYSTIQNRIGDEYKFVNRCSTEYVNQVKNYTSNRKDTLDIALDILQGTGVMELTSFFFIGAYFDKKIFDTPIVVQYNTSLAFYLCLWVTLFVILLVTIISSGRRTLKRINVHTEEATYTFKTLARWDFMMRDRHRVKVERRSIATQLKMELEEDQRRQKKQKMSRGERNRIICKRILVWLFYFLAMGASLVGIYFVINESAKEIVAVQSSRDPNTLYLFLLQYSPSILIFATNFVIEFFCAKAVHCEEYSANIAISITIRRTVILRFISLGVLFISMFVELNRCHVPSTRSGTQCIPNENCKTVTCWETYVGQQIYRLVLLDFLAFFAICILDLIRKFFCGCVKYDISTVFDIPKNVIDLIYTQTLCWLGMFFCPLLSLAFLLKIIFIYFFKKLCVVFRIYQQDDRVSNAAQTDSYFLDTLLFTLIVIVILPLGVGTSVFQPSRSCSPFRLYFGSEDSTIQGAYIALDAAFTQAFEYLSVEAQSIFTIISSYMVIFPIWIILSLVIYYFITLSMARKKLNRYLQRQMVNEMQDQAFHQKRALESLKALKIAQRAQHR